MIMRRHNSCRGGGMFASVVTIALLAVSFGPVRHFAFTISPGLFSRNSNTVRYNARTDLAPPRALECTALSMGQQLEANPVGTQVVAALTREKGKNKKLAEALEKKLGIKTVEIPCITHGDGEDFEKLHMAIQEGHYDYVLITSPQAALVFLTAWNEAGCPRTDVACVGQATGQALKSGGLTPVFTSSVANAETLAAELPLSNAESQGGTRVLYPASSKAQSTLEDALAARGVMVDRLNTYDTVPAAWNDEQVDLAKTCSLVLFGSPSAILTWNEHVGHKKTIAACIGKTTADACYKKGWTEDRVFYPEEPGIDGWTDAAAEALKHIDR